MGGAVKWGSSEVGVVVKGGSSEVGVAEKGGGRELTSATLHDEVLAYIASSTSLQPTDCYRHF